MTTLAPRHFDLHIIVPLAGYGQSFLTLPSRFRSSTKPWISYRSSPLLRLYSHFFDGSGALLGSQKLHLAIFGFLVL